MDYQSLKTLISNRRTVKPALMNGQEIPKEDLISLLQLADWAPTHGRTEPWRFIIFTGESLKSFSQQHAQLYEKWTPKKNFHQYKFDKLIKNGDNASHLIVVLMRRTKETKIPDSEEYAAVAAAVQNMLLGASALDMAAQWSTGGMSQHHAMKGLLNIDPEERVVSFLYLGYSYKQTPKGVRKIPLTDKIIWK